MENLLFRNALRILLGESLPKLGATCIVSNLSGQLKALLAAHDSAFNGSISLSCGDAVLTTKLDKPISIQPKYFFD